MARASCCQYFCLSSWPMLLTPAELGLAPPPTLSMDSRAPVDGCSRALRFSSLHRSCFCLSSSRLLFASYINHSCPLSGTATS